MVPREAALELEKVARALDEAHALTVGLDQIHAATQLIGAVQHSPLRTLLEHAQASTERVITYLRAAGK